MTQMIGNPAFWNFESFGCVDRPRKSSYEHRTNRRAFGHVRGARWGLAPACPGSAGLVGEAKLDPKVVRLGPRSSPGPAARRVPRPALEEVAADPKGLSYRDAGGPPAGRRATCSRGPASVTSSTRCSWSTRRIWPASVARHGPLRRLQRSTTRARRPRTSARGTGRWAAWTSRPSRPPARPARLSPRPWTTGTSRRPTRPWLPSPDRPGPTRSTSCSSATAPATSARSATRRSTLPTVVGRSSASAGSTPSRSCGRWPAPLMHEQGNPPTATTRPTDPGGVIHRTGWPGSREGWSGAARLGRLGRFAHDLRKGSDDDAREQVVELLNRDFPNRSGMPCSTAAGELLLRQPGIVSLHAVTSTNALHYAYQASGDDRTRRLLMLQNAAFLTLFRRWAAAARVRDARGSISSASAGTSESKARGRSRKSSRKPATTSWAVARKRAGLLCRPGSTRN